MSKIDIVLFFTNLKVLLAIHNSIKVIITQWGKLKAA